MCLNQQIRSILWKNMKMTKVKDLWNESFLSLIVALVLFRQNKENVDQHNQFMNILMPIYIPSCFVISCRQLLIEYVHEKTNKYREYYKIMGMKLHNYRIAWFITYIIKSLLIGSILLVTLLYKLQFQESLEIVCCFLLFILALVGQTLLLSTLFSNAQLAGEFGLIFQIILSIFYYASQQLLFDSLVYICPQSTISFYMMNKLNGINKEGLSFYCILSLTIQLLFYCLLFNFKEDQFVIGGKCLQKRKNPKGYVQFMDPIKEGGGDDIEVTGDDRLAFTIIEIVKLFKQFGDVTAIENVNLKIYSQQILCILGQSGAGKTTILSILTGLIEKTSGKIYFGKSLNQKREEIQKLIGFCPQKNLLYNELTINESLQYQIMMKGSDLNSDIDTVLKLMELKQYQNYKVKELCCENKRKLQIALALVGGSQIIFLDEPTACIDPKSRQQIWNIIREIKQFNKTIILTTHLSDEAEELGDQIAIMKNGQVKIHGSPEKIKKELEVGFTLTFGNIQSSQQQTQIKELFSELECSSGSKLEYDNIKYILNQNQLFSIVDKLNELQKIENVKFQLTQNTLQAAYLKLNKDQLDDDKIINECQFQIKSTRDEKSKQLLQISALLQKKYYVFKSNLNLQLMLVLPMLILIFVFYGIIQLIYDEKKIQLLASLIISQSFAFNSSIFIYTPTLERELKIRQQLKQMGMDQFTYIFATFIGDYLIILIFISFIYVLTLSIRNILEQEELFIVLNLFGLSFISFSYAASFMFSSNKIAFKLIPVINFLFCYFLPSIIDSQLSNEYREVFTYIFPNYTLSLALNDKVQTYYQQFLFQFTLFMFIYCILEKQFIVFQNRKNLEDNSIKMEIQNLEFEYTQIRKILQEINLQILPQKVSTILGPDGAGKTTLVQLITDCLYAKTGKIKYNQNIIISSCQQFQGLWEDLTAEQILCIFAKIKGSTNNLNKEISQMLKILSIKGKILNMSTAQKRKVALAVSLVGDSSIIILDEPSFGLDPISRRNLQNMIRQHVQKKNSSIFLTTNDIDEALYLSDNISIMINGIQSYPQQTIPQLIEQFNIGVRLQIKAKSLEALEQVMLAFPKHNKEGFTIEVYFMNEFDVPTIICILRNLFQEDIIESFTIKQANLEQTYFNLCQYQFNED